MNGWIFRTRHTSLALRIREAISGARAKGSNRPYVNTFFDLLEGLLDKHPYPPSPIYHCDETGVTTVKTRPNKVISLKGKRHIACLTSVESRTRITVELDMNAAREYVPPLIIFLRVHMKAELMNGAPQKRSLRVASQAGCRVIYLWNVSITSQNSQTQPPIDSTTHSQAEKHETHKQQNVG